ncbi:MAG: Crp/Fnr family transcriptional regulator [Planctomycetota bacterium]|jgi:CRP/FNR family transcriptional regulator
MLSQTSESELFRGISKNEAAFILQFMRERHFPKGSYIFSEGSYSDCIYILNSGLVKLISHSEKGEETILHILKEGSIFGELLFASDKRIVTAQASMDVTVTVILRKDFFKILKVNPTVCQNFIKILSKRLMKIEREFAHFGHTWSYHRLAMVLLEICNEHGKQTQYGTVIPFPLTHEELANLIGTTRETVTHQLKKFKGMGFLSNKGRKLVIKRSTLEDFLKS